MVSSWVWTILLVMEVATTMSKDTYPCLLLGGLSFIRDDEVTRFCDFRTRYVRPLQFIFPLFVAQSSEYQLS